MRSKRGVVLIIIMIFMIIVAITSLGLYTSVYSLFKAQGVVEVERIRGYYAAFGGLRYAAVLLKNPSAISFSGTPPTATIDSANPTYASVMTDLGIVAPHILKITITEIGAGPNAGQYDVSATYTY